MCRNEDFEDINSCSRCNGMDFTEKNVPPHIGLYCADCGKWFKWVKQNHDNGVPASEIQQKYALSLLSKWKNAGKPMTTAQAGGIIGLFREE